MLMCVDKCFVVITNFASLLQMVKWFCGKVWLEKCSSLEVLKYSEMIGEETAEASVAVFLLV